MSDNLELNLDSNYVNLMTGIWQISIDSLFVVGNWDRPRTLKVKSNLVYGQFESSDGSSPHIGEVPLEYFSLKNSVLSQLCHSHGQKFFEVTNKTKFAKFSIVEILDREITPFDATLVVLLKRVE